MNKCKDCKNFNRWKFHKSIDPHESFQKGGDCKILKEVLSMSNSSIFFTEKIHVYESFGCIFFEGKS